MPYPYFLIFYYYKNNIKNTIYCFKTYYLIKKNTHKNIQHYHCNHYLIKTIINIWTNTYILTVIHLTTYYKWYVLLLCQPSSNIDLNTTTFSVLLYYVLSKYHTKLLTKSTTTKIIESGSQLKIYIHRREFFSNPMTLFSAGAILFFLRERKNNKNSNKIHQLVFQKLVSEARCATGVRWIYFLRWMYTK